MQFCEIAAVFNYHFGSFIFIGIKGIVEQLIRGNYYLSLTTSTHKGKLKIVFSLIFHMQLRKHLQPVL